MVNASIKNNKSLYCIVWLDVSDEHAVVPTFEGLVFAKVSRISSPENSKLDTPVVDENTNSSNSSVLFEQEKSAPDLLNTDDFEGFVRIYLFE